MFEYKKTVHSVFNYSLLIVNLRYLGNYYRHLISPKENFRDILVSVIRTGLQVRINLEHQK